MNEKSVEPYGVEDAEAALEAFVASASAEPGWGCPWAHELTPVVKNCGVVWSGRRPVLQVNPVWLGEIVARGEMNVLADEMRTWSAIQSEVARLQAPNGERVGRCFAA